MGARTKISWTKSQDGTAGATWNPVTGCDKVSPACDHCYADTIAHRFAGTPAYPNGFDVTLRPERLDQPIRWSRGRRIFVNSMSDLFHSQVSDDYIAQIWSVMAAAPQHTFLVLTKRHARMRSLLRTGSAPLHDLMLAAACSPDRVPGVDPAVVAAAPWPLPNVWVGVSAEDQTWADIRIPALIAADAAVRFVSAEPLLAPMHLDPSWLPAAGGPAVDWVIVGGESGPGSRPMDAAWASDLQEQTQAGASAFFFKQAGDVLARQWGLPGKGADPLAWPVLFAQDSPQR